MPCVFCQIIESPQARFVYEDDKAVAFLDIQPWQPGHVVVVPRRHTVDATDPLSLLEVAPAVSEVARLLQDRLRADGVNIVSNIGEAAGQSVFHMHVHVVPRSHTRPGLRSLLLASAAPQAPEEELARMYERLTRF